MGREAHGFSSSKNYAVGDLVIHSGDLYIFTSAHTAAAWDDDDAAKYDNDLEEEITRVLAAVENVESAIAYAQKVDFSTSLIEGTRYKYTFIDA